MPDEGCHFSNSVRIMILRGYMHVRKFVMVAGSGLFLLDCFGVCYSVLIIVEQGCRVVWFKNWMIVHVFA